MKYLNKYKGDRRLQVDNFLKSLNEEWTAITVTEIQNKFFKRSRSFTLSCLKDLEEASIIEKKSGHWSYVNSKWTMNSNVYKLKLSIIISKYKRKRNEEINTKRKEH